MKERFLIATRSKNINEHKAAQQYAFDHGFLWCGRCNDFEDYRDEYDENIWYHCSSDGYLYYYRESYYKEDEMYKDCKIIYIPKSIMETE